MHLGCSTLCRRCVKPQLSREASADGTGPSPYLLPPTSILLLTTTTALLVSLLLTFYAYIHHDALTDTPCNAQRRSTCATAARHQGDPCLITGSVLYQQRPIDRSADRFVRSFCLSCLPGAHMAGLLSRLCTFALRHRLHAPTHALASDSRLIA